MIDVSEEKQRELYTSPQVEIVKEMKEYRIKQAATLLRQTQAIIAEISSQVGYENQSKFASAFKDVMLISPAEYRKQNLSE